MTESIQSERRVALTQLDAEQTPAMRKIQFAGKSNGRENTARIPTTQKPTRIILAAGNGALT
jgi:hypothetical protein